MTSVAANGIAYDRAGPRGALPVVLILVGGLDLDTVHDAAGRVVAGVRRVDWPGAGHLRSIEGPAAFVDLLLHWAGELPATAG